MPPHPYSSRVPSLFHCSVTTDVQLHVCYSLLTTLFQHPCLSQGNHFPPGGPTGRVPVLSVICGMKERVQVTIDGAMGVRQRERRWSP